MTRKYSFRKGQDIEFESHSIMHDDVKASREAARNFERLSREPKRSRKR